MFFNMKILVFLLSSILINYVYGHSKSSLQSYYGKPCKCKCDCVYESATKWSVKTRVIEDNDRFKEPHFLPNRDSIIELFGWKYTDIANECRNELSKTNFAGIQISPVTENIKLQDEKSGEMYQPVSYRINTRRGNEKDLQNMIAVCNSAGIRVYVEVVLNHMAGGGEMEEGYAGSQCQPSHLVYPHFFPEFFHPFCAINNKKDAVNIRNCWLYNLPDLDHSNLEVRQNIVEFLNKLIEFGVAGFRIDAAKYMWPKDLTNIFRQLKDLNPNFFDPGSRPFIMYDVDDLGGEGVSASEYVSSGMVYNFFSSLHINVGITKGHIVLKELIENYGKFDKSGYMGTEDSIVFIEHHQRGRGFARDVTISYQFSPYLDVLATAFMLAEPFGIASILSSYPDTTSAAPINSGVNGDICNINGFNCEHRLAPIKLMNEFRTIVAGTEVTKKFMPDPRINVLGVGRSTKGLLVLNFEVYPVDVKVETAMLPGTYCDIISGGMVDFKCKGITVQVDQDGLARARVPEFPRDPSRLRSVNGPWSMIAIHEESRLPDVSPNGEL